MQGQEKRENQRERFVGDHWLCLAFAGVTTLISDAFEHRVDNFLQIPVCSQLAGMRRNLNVLQIFCGTRRLKAN